MSGGQTHTTQSSNPSVTFTPSSSNGGVISIGGSVGTGNVEFGGSSTASGPSTSLSGSYNGQKLMLQNLDVHMGNLLADGTINFIGGQGGMNTIDNVKATSGSLMTFTNLQNLDNYVKKANV
jgi:hypothetical protein